MKPFVVLPLVAGLGYGLPQDGTSCVTSTSEVIVPTTTATYTTTDVTTIHATGAEDLGTFTLVTTESSTKTLDTLTSTSTDCTSSGTITNTAITATVYTTSGVSAPANIANTSAVAAPTGYAPTGYAKRALGLHPRQDACTIITTLTTTYGQTETLVPAPGVTSTYTDYTDFTQATVTSTKYGGSAYAIATAVATSEAVCGPIVNATTPTTTTITQDSRCAPTALTSAYDGYGLEYADAVPASGASYTTTTDDASQCCQLCAEADGCAASTWSIKTGTCELGFPVDPTTGSENCGEGFLMYYDAGPNHPMAPGTGLFVGTLCGNVEFGSAKPDDGT